MTRVKSAPAMLAASSFNRRFPVGAEVVEGGIHFRVWAPKRACVSLVLERNHGAGPLVQEPPQALDREDRGYFSLFVPDATAGMWYRYRVDDDPMLYPDPASRFQSEGVHGPSMIVDPAAFAWRDREWKGVSIHGQVIYEMHIGTFTQEGSWSAAAKELRALAELGVTVLEVMPVNDFAGRFGWGYDGVNLFAPTRLYGSPDDFRAFVDAAHAEGLGVILDVVYNHFGPSGNYIRAFSDDFTHAERGTEWGESLDYEGPNSHGVREFVISNARYWIEEFHLDGLRLDATQAIHDTTEPHIVAEIGRAARTAAGERNIIVVAENELQDVVHVRSLEENGWGLDGLWNDDFHHTSVVAVTGENDFYFGDYTGVPQEILSAVKWGYLYQGQLNLRQKRRRGTPAFGLPSQSFITFLQNHDQIANSPRSVRLHHRTSPGRLRAITGLMLLAPGTPMLFQGQEFAASVPFLYFADHDADLSSLVQKGRHEFLKNFRRVAHLNDDYLPDPCAVSTFEQCKLDFSERERNHEIYDLHKDLLRLRREDTTIASQRGDWLHGAVLSPEAFVLRYVTPTGDDRLILVNLGRDYMLTTAAEPLLAPPFHTTWRVAWSSEDPKYGGMGTPPPETQEDNWRLLAHSTILMRPVRVGMPPKHF